MKYYLAFAALLPALVLLIRIYQLDRIEKEPRRLLLGLCLLGALAALPTALVQRLLTNLLGTVLDTTSLIYVLLDTVFVVSCSEELGKYLPVRLAAWEHPAFDYRFDAVVYCVCSALGFAAVENILYVLQADWKTALARAVLSVPGHFFFAVAMGLFLSRAKQADRRAEHRKRNRLRLLSLVIPTVLHGVWDFFLTVHQSWAVIAFYGFVASFFITAECFLRRASQTDNHL